MLGQRLAANGSVEPEIVGIVSDVRLRGFEIVDGAFLRQVHEPHQPPRSGGVRTGVVLDTRNGARPGPIPRTSQGDSVAVVVDAQGEAPASITAIHRALRDMDSDLRLYNLSRVGDWRGDTTH
jgi:hypothetical protein